MHTEEYDITQLIKTDNIGKMSQQHVTPIGNPHYKLRESSSVNSLNEKCALRPSYVMLSGVNFIHSKSPPKMLKQPLKFM